MTNVEFSDITIKVEPLSPDSMDQVMSSIPPSHSYNNGLDPQQMNQQHQQQYAPAVLSPTPSHTNTPHPDSKEYLSIHPSLLMSSGIVKANPDHEQATPTNPSTRSALKSSILNRRKARGETTPLTCTDDEGPRDYKLTKREVERKEARKEQNRRAARRCRMKKKRLQMSASQEMQMAVKENVDMKILVENLRQQVNDLKQIISNHEQTQQCKLSPSLCTRLVSNNTHSKRPFTQQPETDATPNTLPAYSEMSVDVNHPGLGSLFTTTTPIPTVTSQTSNKVSSDSISAFPTSLPSNEDWNSFSSDLHTDEESQNLDELLQTLLQSENMTDFETPKIGDEFANPKNNMFSCPPVEESPKNSIFNKTPNSKPTVVRDLSKVFVQSEMHQNSLEKQSQLLKKNNPSLSLNVHNRHPFPDDTVAQASRFLQDPNLSSPIFSCVPPNLVQPSIPIASTSNMENTTLFGNQSFNPFDAPFHPTPAMNTDDIQEDFPTATIETFTRNTLSSSAPFLPYPACHVLPPGATLTDCCINNNNNNITSTADNTTRDNLLGHQLSPISTPSPSSTCTISSPGFLQQISPHDPCHSYDSNNTINDNMVPVFDFNVYPSSVSSA